MNTEANKKEIIHKALMADFVQFLAFLYFSKQVEEFGNDYGTEILDLWKARQTAPLVKEHDEQIIKYNVSTDAIFSMREFEKQFSTEVEEIASLIRSICFNKMS